MQAGAKFLMVLGGISALGFLVLFGMARYIGFVPTVSDTTTEETTEDDQVFRNDPLITYAPDEDNSTAAVSYTEPLETVTSPTWGPDVAPIELFLFNDFECTNCREFSAELFTVLNAFPNQIRLIWKDFPLPNIHPNAAEAAEVARCANEQDLFWEVHDVLFLEQARLGDDLYEELEELVGLDMAALTECRAADEYPRYIEQDYIEGKSLGVEMSPTLFINGEMYDGPLTSDSIIAAIQGALYATGDTN